MRVTKFSSVQSRCEEKHQKRRCLFSSLGVFSYHFITDTHTHKLPSICIILPMSIGVMVMLLRRRWLMLYESNHITVRRKLMFLARSLLIGSKGLPVLHKGMNLKESWTISPPAFVKLFFLAAVGVMFSFLCPNRELLVCDYFIDLL